MSDTTDDVPAAEAARGLVADVPAVFSGDPVWVIRVGGGVRESDPHTGSQVDYAGSLADYHGRYAVLGRCACKACVPDEGDDEWYRYVLVNADRSLTCVGHRSMRVVG